MAAGSVTDRASFVDVLRARCEEEPERIAFLFEDEGEPERLSYGELDERACRVAGALQACGARGERVLLLYPPGLDYVAGLFGCLYAGAVAVPAYPPDPMRPARTLPRLMGIVRDARATAILTTRTIRGALEQRVGAEVGAAECGWVVAEGGAVVEGGIVAESASRAWRPPPLRREDLALLQYTSGSTAAPRGVLLTHANLLHNSEYIRRAFRHGSSSCGVIWLPPYHDMGLVGGVLQPVYAGFPCVLMAPVTFLRRPLRWLRAISEHRATTSGGPNFAYELCVRRIDAHERGHMDLSSWEVAFNGAEPIRRETIDAFSQTFGACGFRSEAFFPCYGLAEATLMVTGGPTGRRPEVRELDAAGGSQVKKVVGCGHPGPDHRVAIVDPESCERLDAGRVGEIWVTAPSVGQGYWQSSVDTAATFAATLPGTGEGPFLRTGDLGLVDEDGELFVTGRIDELLVIDGRNHYPHDLELACEQAVAGLRPGCGAAFVYEVDRRNRVGIVYEVADEDARDHDGTMLAIRQAVATAAEVQVHSVALVRARTIPKTSSGKVQRRLCAELVRAGGLEVVASWSLGRGDAGAARSA
jgi:acyl-CoA synthetase (AMP-forming)/AMP-acid ligase II